MPMHRENPALTWSSPIRASTRWSPSGCWRSAWWSRMLVENSRFGLALMAIRQNELAAEAAGHQRAPLEDARAGRVRRDRRGRGRALRLRAAGGDAGFRVRHAGLRAAGGGDAVRRRGLDLGAGDRRRDPGAAGRVAATRSWATSSPASRASCTAPRSSLIMLLAPDGLFWTIRDRWFRREVPAAVPALLPVAGAAARRAAGPRDRRRCCSVDGSVALVRRPARGQQRELHRRAGRDPRHHRPERRRQDDAVQRAERRAAGGRGHAPRSTASRCSAARCIRSAAWASAAPSRWCAASRACRCWTTWSSAPTAPACRIAMRSPRRSGALQQVGLHASRGAAGRQLTNKQLRLMELARALAGQPRLLLLDETLAGLGREECDDVLDVLARLRDEGMTIAIIEHTMHAMMRLADRFVVLDHGAVLASGPAARRGGGPRGDRGLSRQEMAGAAECVGSDCLSVQQPLGRLRRPARADRRVAVRRRGPVRHRGRAERRRQIDAVQDDLRHRPAGAGTISFRGENLLTRPAAARAHLGIAHVPEGPAGVQDADGAREPGDGRLHQGRPRAVAAHARAHPHAVPDPGRTRHASSPAHCRAASSRCWRSAAAWRRRRGC